MLTRHHQVDLALENRIDTLELEAKQLFGLRNEIAVADLVDMYHKSMYQDAVHSMAAVGSLAPLIESFFTMTFYEIEKHMKPPKSHVQEKRSHWKKGAWDCHYFLNNDKKDKNVVCGIKELVKMCGMVKFMPRDLNITLDALFAYRNKMSHCGFRWPQHECDSFEKHLTNWPCSWFKQATCDGKPAEFYMSKDFIDHCIETIDQVIDGVVEYGKSQNEKFKTKSGDNQVKFE